MSYDLNAEGTNGVGSETTVVALAGFTSEFNISVWNVDATAAAVIHAISGVTSCGAIGYGTEQAEGRLRGRSPGEIGMASKARVAELIRRRGVRWEWEQW